MTARDSYVSIVRAGKALRALAKDPEDSSMVFEIVEALRPKKRTPILNRLQGTNSGARMLRERPSILDTLRDHAHLASLPENSVGRAYLRYLESSGISADGLVRSSQIRRTPWSDEGTWLTERMRDTHDLWHVVTGYGSDVAGEMLVLAFSFGQTKNPGIGVIVLASLLANLGTPLGADIALGYVRGVSAEWLPAVEWEELLARPLAEVRALLKVGEPPHYQPSDLDRIADAGLFGKLLNGHRGTGPTSVRPPPSAEPDNRMPLRAMPAPQLTWGPVSLGA